MNTAVKVVGNFPDIDTRDGELFSVEGTGAGSTKKAAIAAGVRSVLNNPALKGKRYSSVKFTVNIIDSPDEAKNNV